MNLKNLILVVLALTISFGTLSASVAAQDTAPSVKETGG